jgi:hypothetical protein
MLCPECHQRLIIIEYHDVELDVCHEEHGMWFDADELRRLFEAAKVHASLHDLESRLETLRASGKATRRKCPRCGGRLVEVLAPGGASDVILDSCPHGHGLWFDQGELHDVLTAKIPEGDEALLALREYLGAFVEPRTPNRGAHDA